MEQNFTLFPIIGNTFTLLSCNECVPAMMNVKWLFACRGFKVPAPEAVWKLVKCNVFTWSRKNIFL